jgi:hypothetical protein
MDTETSTVMSTGVKVYPNPSQGEFIVSVPDKTSFDLFLYDALGKLVMTETVQGHEYIMSKNALAEGISIMFK